MNATVVIDTPVAREDIDALRRRVAREAGGAEVVVCDLSGLPELDVATVEALARLQLDARRRGRTLRLRGAPQRLRELIALCGLEDVLAQAY